MKKITTLLIALFCVAIAANATVTVNVRTSTGEPPYLYVWNGDPINGAWPGTQMDATQTSVTEDGLVWFTQVFDYDAINIVLNDGGIDGEEPFVQTQDLLGVTGTVYYIFDPEEGDFENVTGDYVEIQEFDPSILPSSVVFVEGKEFAYFIAPATWTVCNVWCWSNTTGTHFLGNTTWPGDAITMIGNTTDGAPVFQWTGPDINENDRPEFIIFSKNGNPQTANLDYVAGGVYDISGKLLYTVPAGGGSEGNIQLLEPVITDNFIEFVGVNNFGNYKFTLNNYEWPEDHGPQFQLTIEPIDPTQPAFFSAADLNDPNYWEPMFKRVTQQMAGSEMTAQDNIKRLYLGDVQLLENQFTDYHELHIVGFDLKKDYTLPAGCLLNAGQHMDEMDVKCDGTMTLEPNSLPANKAFVVNVYTQEIYNVWNTYKQTYNCQYILNLNTAVPGDVNGDGEVTAADVTALYDVLLNNDYSNVVNGDQNGDGEITAADVTAVYDVLLGS